MRIRCALSLLHFPTPWLSTPWYRECGSVSSYSVTSAYFAKITTQYPVVKVFKGKLDEQKRYSSKHPKGLKRTKHQIEIREEIWIGASIVDPG
uniref:Putative secreted protein n=1 Tax=Anopheles triannulatus TaxID=58253 RepID=A0A2M4B3I6_9DIPT